MATGTVTWIDADRGCCFIACDVARRDLYVDQAEIDSHSTALEVGARVEFTIRTGPRGRFVLTNVVAKDPANGGVERSQPPAEAAADVWEGEGGTVS